jgi:hypothetical protein
MFSNQFLQKQQIFCHIAIRLVGIGVVLLSERWFVSLSFSFLSLSPLFFLSFSFSSFLVILVPSHVAKSTTIGGACERMHNLWMWRKPLLVLVLFLFLFGLVCSHVLSQKERDRRETEDCSSGFLFLYFRIAFGIDVVLLLNGAIQAALLVGTGACGKRSH